MKIDWKHLIAPAIALVIIALVVSAYVSERIDRIKAESAVDAKVQIIAERDKATAELVQTLKDAAAKVTKPEQVAAALPQVIELKTPIVQVPDVQHTEHVPANVVQDIQHSQLPNAASVTAQPGDLIIRKDAAVEFYQHENTCKQNDALLSTCQANLKDTEQQRDAALTAVKGGSFFTRLKRNTKWFAVGAAVGAGGILATRH